MIDEPPDIQCLDEFPVLVVELRRPLQPAEQLHALRMIGDQGVKLFGWLQGATEFYDEHGTFIETLDVWWFINHYESYCRAQGIPINKQLYL